MTPEQKPFIFPSFTKPCFIYCPLKWIFQMKHSTGGINNINTLAYALSNQNKPDFKMKNQFTTNEESSLSLKFINTK